MTALYDPTEYSLNFAGVIPTGYGEDEFLRVEKLADNFVEVVGTDGEVSRSKVMDKRATITFVLMKTSKTNALLSAIAARDENLPNGAGVGAVFIRDRQGDTVFRAAQAWIVRQPDVSLGKQAQSIEWQIRCAKLIPFIGGN